MACADNVCYPSFMQCLRALAEEEKEARRVCVSVVVYMFRMDDIRTTRR